MIGNLVAHVRVEEPEHVRVWKELGLKRKLLCALYKTLSYYLTGPFPRGDAAQDLFDMEYMSLEDQIERLGDEVATLRVLYQTLTGEHVSAPEDADRLRSRRDSLRLLRILEAIEASGVSGTSDAATQMRNAIMQGPEEG